MNVTEKILCSKSHEYLLEHDNECIIGLTHYAVEQLGDIVFLELPEVGTSFRKNEVFATVESVKTASEVYMPISGTVVEINEAVVDRPEILNESPYENGWLIKIKNEIDTVELADLLEYNDYKEEIE